MRPPDLVIRGTLRMSGEAGTPMAEGAARRVLRVGAVTGTGTCGPADGLETTPSSFWILDDARTSDEVCITGSERVTSKLRASRSSWTIAERRTQVPEPSCGEEGKAGPSRTVERTIEVTERGFRETCEPAP